VRPLLYIGLISGTSRDGVDAALVGFEQPHPIIRAAVCVPYPAALARNLNRMILAGERPDTTAQNEMDMLLADHFSETVRQLLQKAGVSAADITAIGSHGQTIWHQPEGLHPESIQSGDPERIAVQTGIVTVGDFRRADIEAGGQGAPLAPLLHRALFRPTGPAARVVLNLGGIANISIIDNTGAVSGFDTGPANCLLDTWIRKHRNEPFDCDGQWAAGGQVIHSLLEKMLADPYFQQAAPKSTGIEYFNLGWLESFRPEQYSETADVQATLAELTAVSVADSIRPHTPGDVLVCGGGVHNTFLTGRLQQHLQDIPVRSTAEFGLDPDWIEAMLFAWLARVRLAGQTLDTRSITGAAQPVLLGVISSPH